MVHERKIVNGEHDRSGVRWHRQTRGVDHVDRTCRALDRGATQLMPCLVEREPVQRQPAHGDRRPKRRRGQPPVPRGNSQDVDAGIT
jgi:hypothetical protein